MTITNPTVGINTAYDLTTGVPVNIDELIYMISPDDSPLISGINSDGLQVLPRDTVDQIEFEWLDEEMLTPTSTLAASATAGTTTFSLAAGDREKFSTGDLVKIAVAGDDSGEVLRVTAYDGANDDVVLTRAFASTTATAYATSAQVIGIGTLLAEGSDPENARSADRTSRSNYTQIFGPTKIEMSRTEQGRRKYGVANEFTHQLMNRMKEDVIRRERALLYGVKYNDASSKMRTTGGLNYWINTNEDTSTTALTIATIEALQQSCYDAGGVPDMISANPSRFGGLNDLDDTNRVRVTFEDPKRGRQPAMMVFTEFGALTAVRNRWVMGHNAFMWNRSQATLRVFDPARFERLAKTGDSDKGQIVCEEGLEFKGEVHAAKFSGLTG